MKTEPLMDRAKRRLGRGLSSLIGDPVAVEAAPVAVGVAKSLPALPSLEAASPGGSGDPRPAEAGARWAFAPKPGADAGGDNGLPAAEGGVVHVDIDAIVPSRFQPRREMDPGALERLAESIRRSGLMQPVVVRPSPLSSAGYELVAGERRWRAARAAGLRRIPAVVRRLSDEDSAEWALVENLQREDLNPMDRAASLRVLCERFGLRQEDVSARVGLDRSTVANLIRLTELEEPLARLVASGTLSAGHGRALLSLPAGEARVSLGTRAGSERWSVRRLEREVGGVLRGTRRAARDPFDAREAARQRVEKRLAEHLGTKVMIATDRSGTRGRITVEFYGLDHFEGLLTKLGLDPRE